MAPNGKCTFNPDWMENESYKEWLLMDSTDKHRAKCRVCKNKSFSVASMGESALGSHMKYRKHRDRLKALQSASLKVFCSLSSASTSSSVPNNIKEKEAAKKEESLEKYVQKTNTLDAEILWTLNCVKWHHSFRSNTKIDTVLRKMFPDSAIAANFTCSERKTAYYALFGLAPHFKNILLKDLEKKDLVLLFDETLNSKSLAKQLDIYVRFWANDRIKTAFFACIFLGHATANDMFEHLLNAILPISFRNILQLSMDGPNVNLKLHKMADEYIFNEFNKHLINIGTCTLHVLHNAFKQGFNKLDWDVATFLSNCYQLFKYSPARREDYSTISGSRFPLKFVFHRWVENVPVCERALEILPHLCTYVMLVEKGKFTEPACKSFENIKKNIKDNLFPVKLNIFLSIASIIQPFLEKYQTDKPMLPFMAEDLKTIILALMQRFLKPKLLQDITIINLTEIEYENAKNHLATDKIDLGFAAEKKIRELHSSKKISDGNILNLRRDLKSCLIKMLSTIISKSPINFSIVQNLSCLVPMNLVNDKQKCLRKIKFLLNSLSDLSILKITDCDEIYTDFVAFINYTVVENTSEFLNFDSKNMRLDDFLSFHVKSKHVKVWPFIQKILLLSHGQATVERGFSVNKKVEVENLKEKSYEALRLICDHIQNLGGDVTKIVIDKELRSSVMAARQRYCQYLEDEKKSAERVKQKRLLEHQEENELTKKRKYLSKCIDELSKFADDYAEEAEEKNDMTLLLKSNSLRRSAKAKQAELLKLQENQKNV